jgi:hypothetical protein
MFTDWKESLHMLPCAGKELEAATNSSQNLTMLLYMEYAATLDNQNDPRSTCQDPFNHIMQAAPNTSAVTMQVMPGALILCQERIGHEAALLGM